MSVHGTFRFHPIGQGLFYSGILMKKDGRQNHQFSFVYDCGTDSPRDFLWEEIDRFKLLLKKTGPKDTKKLDLLIVSHLHDDHVNGLERLLDGVEVDTVVMPYLSDGLSYMARLESSYDEAFLQSFYLDPVAWFESKGVRRILLLGADEEIIKSERNNRMQRRENEDDLSISHNSILMTEENGKTEPVYLKNSTILSSATFYWQFYFENLPVRKMGNYVHTVEAYLRQNCLTLSRVLASRTRVQELRRSLNRSFGGSGIAINRTSVVLLHNPGKSYQTTSWIPSITPVCHKYFSYKECFFLRYTILTGDIELMGNETISVLSNKDRSGYETLLQYPHHGASQCRFDVLALDSLICVVLCGITNKYGHPDPHTLRRFHPVELVNERHSFDYEIFAEEKSNR